MRIRCGLLAVLLAGCEPIAWPEAPGCPSDRPEPGTVVVSALQCNEQRLSGGEARTGDFYLANAWFKAALRHPIDALTLAGAGGGTLVDAAPWDARDRLHEAVPLVDGGWLQVDTFEPLPDGFRVGGHVVSLPDQPVEAEGARREITWRIAADGPWLDLEGADGLWLHASGAELLDGQVVVGNLVYGHDGIIVQDLGGAVRIDGVTRLRIGDLQGAWAWRAAEPMEIAGDAPDATSILLYREGTLVGRLPVEEDRFAGWVDPSVTGVQARAGGRGHSPIVAPGTDLWLEVGAPARLQLHPVWEDHPRQLQVSWRAADGRSGSWSLGPDGGTLGLGEGVHELTVSAGPAYAPRDLWVSLGPDDEVELPVALRRRFDPGSRALTTVGLPADRSRSWRGSDLSGALRAAATGFDYAVFVAEDDVPSLGTGAASFPALLAQGGVLFPSRSGDWQILAWPFEPANRKNASGAPNIDGWSPEEALALVTGAPGRGRLTAVDLGWLEAVGPPHTLEVRPNFVHLPHPGVAGSAWGPWFEWLDAGALLVPLGPATWVEVSHPQIVGRADIEQGLIPGHLSTGTGPLITLEVDGVGPGDIHPGPLRAHEVVVEVHGEPELKHVLLLGQGGEPVLVPKGPPPWTAILDTPWVIALAWSSTSDAWAVTGPVWLDPP